MSLMEKVKNVAQHGAEYLLILLFLAAAYGEVTTNETVQQGFLGFLFSAEIISVIYAIWFVLMALALLYSKIAKKDKLHKHALAAMYLTTVYTISLSLALFGFGGAAIIDDSVIGLTAAICWLRWKLKTEYVDIDKYFGVKDPS
jgi:hypothetical protein